MRDFPWVVKTLPLLIGIGLLLSACVSDSDRSFGPGDRPTTWFGISVGSSWDGWHSGSTNDHSYLGE